jgi:hypothetical protein
VQREKQSIFSMEETEECYLKPGVKDSIILVISTFDMMSGE